jgi:hypothetical protein
LGRGGGGVFPKNKMNDLQLGLGNFLAKCFISKLRSPKLWKKVKSFTSFRNLGRLPV